MYDKCTENLGKIYLSELMLQHDDKRLDLLFLKDLIQSRRLLKYSNDLDSCIKLLEPCFNKILA